jgi:hypothetical protein
MLSSSTPLMGKLRSAILAVGAVCGFTMTSNLHAADAASAQISDTSLGGGEFAYSITLKDTGTGNLGTFWYSWVPGQDFMPVSPTNVVAPSGWTDLITNGGSSDGFAIQFVSSSAPLTPGASDTFTFDSTATPAQIAGDSPFHSTMPVDTAFVYNGAPFETATGASDVGFQLQVATASVPEPSSMALVFFSVGALGLWAWSRKALAAR